MSEPLTFKSTPIQHLRRLLGRRSARYEARQFAVEGAVLIREALSAGLRPDVEFVAPGAESVAAGRCRSLPLADGVIERVGTTTSPQPNIAIFDMPTDAPALSACDLVLATDRINDPGNLGTILRSCEAAGADAVVITPGSTDPFSPKVVRSSAGAVCHLAIIEADLAELRDAGLRLVGTSSHDGHSYRSFVWPERVAIVMGSEAHGLDDDALIDDWVRIPHRGRAESLNVAMAATLLVFGAANYRADHPVK